MDVCLGTRACVHVALVPHPSPRSGVVRVAMYTCVCVHVVVEA